MNKPSPDQYPEYYHGYISGVPETECLDAITSNELMMRSFFEELSDNFLDNSYEPGKWTVREVVQHIIDVERVMAYRALRFARADTTDIPGFDHDAWPPHCNSTSTVKELKQEFLDTRAATKSLFKSFTEDQFSRSGTANGLQVNVNALGFIISGHCLHHVKILKDRYLN